MKRRRPLPPVKKGSVGSSEALMRAEGLAICLALVGEVEKLMDVKFEGDIYKKAFSNVAGVPVDQVNAEQRQLVKIVSFGARHGGSMQAALNSWKLKKGR